MATARSDVRNALAVHDEAALRAILDAAGVSPRGAETSAELASRIADALWWSFTTPLGYATDQATLEEIVSHTARKLRVDPETRGKDVWEALDAMTQALFEQIPEEGVALDDLEPAVRKRLSASWLPTMAWGSGAGGSFGARWGAGKVLLLLKGPIGRLLPYFPPLAPVVGPVRVAASAVHMVSGPLGIAMATLALNSALGTNYRKLVPLLLGVAALGPRSVTDAEELPLR